MAYNLQNDSEDFPDVSDALTRSRDEWLGREEVHTIFNLHEDPTVSLDPVEPFEEGLYLFDQWSIQDNNDWSLFDDGFPEKTKSTREHPPLVYKVSRLLLDPIEVGMRSTYVKRVYCPNLDVDHVLAHYRIIYTLDGASEDDSGDDVEEDEDDTEEDTESSGGGEKQTVLIVEMTEMEETLILMLMENNGTTDSQTTHLSGGMQVCIQDFIVNCPKEPIIEILQFEKHEDKDQKSQNDKDPYGNLLKWLMPLGNTSSQPPRSLPTPLIPSPGISSTAHKPVISSTSGSQLLSLGHLRSYSMSDLHRKSGNYHFLLSGSFTPSSVADVYDSNCKAPCSSVQGVRMFINSNHQEETIVVSMSMPGFESRHYAPGGKGYISNSINSQPLVGVPIMAPRILLLPVPSSIVGTTDIRSSSKPIWSPAQLSIFYAGPVCVYVAIIVFEEPGKNAFPSSVPIACIEAGHEHSLPNLTLRKGEEHSLIVKPAFSVGAKLKPSAVRKELKSSSLSLQTVNFERKGSGLSGDQYAVMVSCRCNFLESRLFFKQRTNWRLQISRDLMISVASEMSGEPCGPHGRASQLPVQASNLTLEDLSLSVLAPASFTSPPSVVSLNSTPTSPLSPFLWFSEFTERVQSEKRNTTRRKHQSLPPIPLETRTENTNSESSDLSDVIPKSGLGCTHLWLQSRVPLGCVPSKSTATIKLELLPLTDGIITLDTLQIHAMQKGRRYIPGNR